MMKALGGRGTFKLLSFAILDRATAAGLRIGEGDTESAGDEAELSESPCITTPLSDDSALVMGALSGSSKC